MKNDIFGLLASLSTLAFTILGTISKTGDEKIAWFFAALWSFLSFVISKRKEQ